MANRQTFLGSLDSTNVVCRGERIFHVTMGTPEYEKYNLSFPLALKISTEFEAFYLRPFIYFYKKRITCLIFFLYNFTQGGLCRSQSASCHRRPWLGAPWPPGPPVTRCSPQAWSPPPAGRGSSAGVRSLAGRAARSAGCPASAHANSVPA